MAHETHNDASSEKNKSIVSFKSSFWLVVILVGLFIAALNFIKVMGEHEGGKVEKTEATEMKGEKTEEPAKEAEGAKKEEVKADTATHNNAKEEAKPAAANAPEHK